MKKRIHKKTPRKIKQSKKNLNKKTIPTLIIIMISILIGIVVGVLYGTKIDEVAKDIKNITTVNVDDMKNEDKKEKTLTYEEKTRALKINYANNTNNNLSTETPKENQTLNNTFHFEEPNLEQIDTKEEHLEAQSSEVIKTVEVKEKEIFTKPYTNKPKLAIIIDDVTTQRQIKSIKNIGYKVNMAFLPPTTGHKNSARITKNLEQYMIHLPLQASSSKYEEENTLYIHDGIKQIEKRILYLKKLYPKAIFINNHTGSKFTSHQDAMDKLFQVLKKYDYNFIDSRTTAKSVAKLSAKKYGVKMFSRDIFLDNKKDKKYIQKQLKKAIKIAKSRGISIAIGHPYSITFQTLKDSKELLKDLELVYVSQL